MPKCGSLNWVIFVTFDDGIEWVFRSPMAGRNHFYSDETSSKIVESEASTLMYLKVYSYRQVPGTSDNIIGVPYILQSKAAGRSLGSRHPRPMLPISDKGREKIMEQLGSIMAELSDHRFDKIGSLFNNKNGGYDIGECLSPSLAWQERDSLDLNRGPFHQEQDYLVSLISAFTSHARELPLTPHMFYAPVPDDLHYKTIDSHRIATQRWNEFASIGQKIDHSKNRIFYCIVGQFLLEMIPYLSSGLESSFTLSHPDLHVGNLYVDDDLNITCIIDWSSASTGPISELLMTPGLGDSARPPSDSLTAAFRSGFASRINLWQKSDNMWPFSRIVRQTDENMKLLAELQDDDMTIEEVQEQERMAISSTRRANSDAIAIARKLTLMSEMNPGFLANHVLWQWVEEALKQDGLP
ncbi:hypothetical protein GGI43DRAFT_421339 [Trichoderma evansii]